MGLINVHHQALFYGFIFISFVATTVSGVGESVNGEWGDWKPWSRCSKTCGLGEQYRERACDTPSPAGGGATCVGPQKETRSCGYWACPDCNKFCDFGGELDGKCQLCMCRGDAPVVGRAMLAHTPFPAVGVRVFAVGKEDEPVAISNSSGYFEVKGLCRGELRLRLESMFYVAEENIVGVDELSSEYNFAMLQKWIRIKENPVSQVAFVNNKVTFSCLATSVPVVSHFEWYKDGILVRVGEVGDMKGRHYTVEKVKEKDAGHYRCLAITFGGDHARMSRPARLTVMRRGTKDSCEETPEVEWVTLGAGCEAVSTDGEVWKNNVNLGHCGASNCTTLQPAANVCCDAVAKKELTVRCKGGLEYPLWRTERCGCTVCTSAMDGSVEINGNIRILSKSDNRLNYSPPHARINIAFDEEMFFSTENGRFSLTVKPPADTVALVFWPYPWDHYMPHVHVVSLVPDVATYNNQLVLLPHRPKPQYLKAKTKLTAVSSTESATEIKVIIPSRSIISSTGQLENGKVLAFVTYDSAQDIPGRLVNHGSDLGLDSNGHHCDIDSDGILNVYLMTESQNMVSVAGDIAIEITFTEDQSEDMNELQLWSLESETGRWHNPLPLTELKVKKDTHNGRKTTWMVHAPVFNGVMMYNLARKRLPYKQCWATVYLYQDEDFVAPVSTPHSLSVTTFTKDGSRRLYEHTTRPEEIGRDGKICVPIKCGLQHELFLSNGVRAQASTTHHLPDKSIFKNTQNATKIVFISPNASDVNSNGEGPVHLSVYKTCQKTSEQSYHFKFRLFTEYETSQLNMRQPLPNMKMSWKLISYQNVYNEACFVRVRVDTFNPSDIRIWAPSFLDEKREDFLGDYVTYVEPFYPPDWDSPMAGSHYACVEVRCPQKMYSEEHVDTHVELQLLQANKSCKLVRTREDDDVDRNHPEQDAIFQGYQQIQVTDTSPSSLTFSVALMNCAGYSDGMWCRHGDPYLFSDSGMGRKASSGASLKCQQDFIFNVAHFDCTGGEVPLRWTTANTSIHDSFS